MSKMLNIRQVRDMLGLSYDNVIRLVKVGKLTAYRYWDDGPPNRNSLDVSTQGLRFKETEVEEFLEHHLVK